MSRFGPPVIGAAVLAGSLWVPGVIVASAAPGGDPSYSYCPAAKHLIGPETHWRRHQLAPGVTLAESEAGTNHEQLKLRVVRVNLGRPNTEVAPLHRRLASRHPLTRLAARPHLVAATNGMFFDWGFGAPRVPFIGRSRPFVLSRQHTKVAGIGVNGRAQDGQVWLAGHVTSVRGRHPIGAINDVTPPRGLALYTPSWGSAKIPLPLTARSQAVRGGHLVGPVGRRRGIPRHGELLVATKAAAVNWLARLPRSSQLSVSYGAKTNARHPFSQAYGVGIQVVASAHHVESGLYCDRGEIYAARTDIAWRNHGRQLILATVVGARGSEHAGVDENQMSQVMVQLGADRSYALDGGGSTELVARMHGQHKLSVRTRPGSPERAIPVGIGVYSLPKSEWPKHKQPRHKKHHRHGKHHRKKSKGLGGLLPPVLP